MRFRDNGYLKKRERCEAGTIEISIQRNPVMAKKVFLLIRDSTFNVVAAMEMFGQHVQCGHGNWNLEYLLRSMELSSFRFG